MRYRKLRIAFSVVCGLLCLLLIMLCVRSYRQSDTLYVRVLGMRVVQFDSTLGHLLIESPSSAAGLWRHPREWYFMTHPAPQDESSGLPMFAVSLTLASPGILLNFWIAVLALGLGAGMPWVKIRFSLRALLIATTLVAVILGTIVIAARQ
jgi:catechol 2,3-dioxygenase-like lactoylglutathione lyase family enzyme